MDCQTLIKNNLRLNKNKRIGTLIFVVEGNKTEIELLKRIFSDILDYNFLSENREGKKIKFKSKLDKYSTVYVFNSENSNIKSIASETLEDELSEEIRLLYDENFAIEDAAIFYIFDRDYKSNRLEVVEGLIDKYYNSRESKDYNMQGLLLLSYPAVEAYICEAIVDKYYKRDFDLGLKLKRYLQNRKIKIEDIKDRHLLSCCKSMSKTLNKFGINDFDIDDFTDTNMEVLKNEEEILKDIEGYRVLSLISVALLDLGIIEVINEKQ